MKRKRERETGTEGARGGGGGRAPAGEERERTQTVEAETQGAGVGPTLLPLPRETPVRGGQNQPTLADSDSVGASRDGHTGEGDVYRVDTLHGGLVATAIGAVAPRLQLRFHGALLSCRVLDHDLHLARASSCHKVPAQLLEPPGCSWAAVAPSPDLPASAASPHLP